MTGLPASGKSTTGAALASALALPLLAKDDILEALFETASVGDRAPHSSAPTTGEPLPRDPKRASVFSRATSWSTIGGG